MRTFAIAAALVALTSFPAMAQRRLEVPATAAWKHAETGLVLRARLADLPRTELTDSTANELDVAAQFGSTDDIAITLYIFRPAVQSVPLWFDRAETQILLRESFGGATPYTPVRAFAAAGSTVASALRRSYVPGNGSFKSTALAMVPLGEWLVAIRISAVSLDPAALETRLDAAIADIGWPGTPSVAAPAVPIAACPAPPLAYAKRVKVMKPSMVDALLGATIAGLASAPEKREAAEPVLWCREGAGTSLYGVYRSGEGTNSYLMPIGDAGRAIGIAAGFPMDGEKPGFTVSLYDLDKTLVYPKFNGLPHPDQALEAVRKGRPISSSARGGKEMTISME